MSVKDLGAFGIEACCVGSGLGFKVLSFGLDFTDFGSFSSDFS